MYDLDVLMSLFAESLAGPKHLQMKSQENKVSKHFIPDRMLNHLNFSF